MDVRVFRLPAVAGLFVVFITVLGGCATSPPIGVWFGPSTPAPITLEPQPQVDQSALIVHTPHYKIYTTIEDEAFVRQLAELMEGSLTAYHALAPDVPVTTYPMQCYVFSSRSQWEEFTREHTGGQASVFLKINRGGYCVFDWYVAYFIGQGATLSVSSHEGWHQFCARHFKGRLPPFLEEGLATMFEDVQFENGLPRYNLSINEERAIKLRTAIDKQALWPLEDAIQMDAGQVVGNTGEKIDAWYSQAWGLGRFLWDADGGKYRPALRRLLADTASGKVYDPTGTFRSRLRPFNRLAVKPLLEHYLGMSFDQIDAEYGAFIRNVAYHELPTMSDRPQ